MKKLLILAALVLMVSPVQAGDLVQGPNVHFDTDQSEIINLHTLDTFAKTIHGSVESLYIYCHTDSRASNEHNYALAQRRCDTVAEFIESKYGMQANKYVIVGERQSEVDEIGTDEEGRRGINRRVQILYSVEEIQNNAFKRHRITLAGGYAPSGIDSPKEISPGVFEVKEDWDLEAGIGYSYRLTRTFNAGINLYTNKSGFLHLGVDF